MELKKLRIPIGLIIGIAIELFGVFLFSSFRYRGLSLEEHIFPLLNSYVTFSDGVFQMLSSGFTINFFDLFSSANGESYFEQSVWPLIVTWVCIGYFTGTIVKGAKRGLEISITVFIIIFFLWLIFSFFAGADLGTKFIDNIAATLGQLLFAIIFVVPSGIIGGAISGPYESD